MKLTIFTTCRPFEGEFADIQRNAVTSWALLKPEPQIILIGAEMGTAELAKDMRLKYLPSVQRNIWDTPLLSSLFWSAITCGTGDVLCYVNSDIILLDDFMPAVEACARKFSGAWLLTGPRWDVPVEGQLNIEEDWRGSIRKTLKEHGKRHKPTGLDYFVFPRGTFEPASFPPLAVGRTAWDAWLVWKARSKRVPTIDGSMSITAVHQMHEKGGKPEEKKTNQAMASSDRLGRGYIWEGKYRVVPGPGRKLIVQSAPDAAVLWSANTGWEDWE